MYAYSNIEFHQQIQDEFIEIEMQRIKRMSLSQLFLNPLHLQPSPVHLDLQESYALTLAYGYFDSYEPALTIASHLDLCKLDFLAIMGDLESFREEYFKNY